MSAVSSEEVCAMVLMNNLESQESNADPVEPYLRPHKVTT